MSVVLIISFVARAEQREAQHGKGSGRGASLQLSLLRG
jgi:hypothetical protein